MDKLDDLDMVCHALREAAEVACSTLLETVSHHFHPQGVTALALLAESHIAIHTWPERGYAAVDLFTCGERSCPVEACQYLIRFFEATDHDLQIMTRGTVPLNASPSTSERAVYS